MKKNLPANPGDVDSIPDLGRSHMSTEELSWYATTMESVLQSPRAASTEATCPRSHVPRQEKSQQ